MFTDMAWAGLLGGAAALEIWAIKHSKDNKDGGTFSHLVRRLFFTHTLAGRIIFAAGWLIGAGWFWAHILGWA